jgi:ABC-2 type transport system ATP-binding protein
MQLSNVDASPRPPVVVEVADVSKRFVVRKDNSLKERIVTLGRAGRRYREEFWALSDVSASIRAGETIGLIGHNGSGKSTLLKIIGGILEPSKGRVDGRGRVAALLELGAGFHPDLTGRENVFLNASVLGLSRAETESKFDDIVAFSGIGEFIDTQVKFYSSGMYVRLAFAVAVHTDPDVLIVDEVLAVGDEAFQRKCMDKIKAFQAEGRTIILVTHSMGQVAELCDRAILLDHGKVVIDGTPNEVIATFRDILEQRRLAESDLAGRAADDPSHAKISATRVRIPGRGPGEPARPGDDIVIETTLSHPTGLPAWLCAIQIDNEHGQVVFGTNTDHERSGLGSLVGERQLEVRIVSPMFGQGTYHVSVALLDPSGNHLADASLTTSFVMEADGPNWGSVYAMSRVEEPGTGEPTSDDPISA